jgi:hypothetical protein
LAPNLIDMTSWPDGSVFHHGRTRCFRMTGCLWPSTSTIRWTVRI